MITSSMKTSELEKSTVVGIPIYASSIIDTSSISEEEKAAKEKKKFRINAKSVCLHYPKDHGLTHQSILEQLSVIFKGQIKNYLIAKECSNQSPKERSHNVDKTLFKTLFHVVDRELYHFHVFLEFFNKVNIISPFGFDLLGSNKEQVHGHYHTMKKKEAVMRYFSKEDKELLTSFDLTVDGIEKTRKDIFMESLMETTKKKGVDAAMRKFCKERPEMVATRYNAVKTNLTKYENSIIPPIESHYPIESFDRIPELDFWHKNCKNKLSLIIRGGSGNGKTEMIIAYLNAHMHRIFLCRNINSLADFTRDFDVVLFDDINATKMNIQDKIELFDVERPTVIKILYEIKKIKADVLKVFTTNKLESLISEEEQKDEALMRRVYIINVDKKLFRDMNISITTNNYFAAPPIDNMSSMDNMSPIIDNMPSIPSMPPMDKNLSIKSIKKEKKSKALLEDNVVEVPITRDAEVRNMGKVKKDPKSMVAKVKPVSMAEKVKKKKKA